MDEGVTVRPAGAPEPCADDEDGDHAPPPAPAPPCLRMLALRQARSKAVPDMAGIT